MGREAIIERDFGEINKMSGNSERQVCFVTPKGAPSCPRCGFAIRVGSPPISSDQMYEIYAVNGDVMGFLNSRNALEDYDVRQVVQIAWCYEDDTLEQIIGHISYLSCFCCGQVFSSGHRLVEATKQAIREGYWTFGTD